MTFTVLLQNGTVGSFFADAVSEGDYVTVDLHDENGNPIKDSGIVSEIIEFN